MAPLDEVQVGDLVNVPGGMYGTVKFLGSVAGKPGRFAGIELSAEHAPRGKNSGEVDGRKYFTTSTPGSGIFVPMNNSKYVTKRSSSAASGTFATPKTPSRAAPANNLSKSVGPSPAVPRPQFRRPSQPRPESPRAPAPAPATTPAPPPKLSLGGGGLRTPSAASKTGGSNGLPRSPVKAPSRQSDRPLSRMSLEDNGSSYGRPSDVQASSSSDFQDLKDQIKSLETQLVDRDKQLNEQTSMLGDFQKTLEELEGSDALSIRAQLRERNERITQLTAEFDGHRADFRSTLDTLEIAASETERVYEQRLDELLQQNKELQDRGEDVEVVARQLKQLEELVSELEEGLEDARRGEAEARAEVEFLRGEVERTKLELEKEREAKGTDTPSDAPRNSNDLDQKDDEIRGLKAIIHSLSRGNPNTAKLHATESLTNTRGTTDNDQVSRLEQRIEEAEGLARHKDSRIEELERELQEARLNAGSKGRTRSSTVTMSPSKQHKPSGSASKIASNGNTVNQPHRLSDRTVVPSDWQDESSSEAPQHHRGASSSSQRRLATMSERSSDEDSQWCEICETSGHDILNCTSMFGSGNGPKKQTPRPAEARVSRPTANTKGDNADADKFASNTRADSQKTGRDVVLEGLQGIGGSMAPIAGKSSGVIDESKWCALCERDGHESIDCPFDE